MNIAAKLTILPGNNAHIKETKVYNISSNGRKYFMFSFIS
jgi:hypothetical protein